MNARTYLPRLIALASSLLFVSAVAAPQDARCNQSVQYVASPGYGWEKTPPSVPSIYESWTDLQPLAWTHLRLEVHGRKAQIFLNGSPHPSLIVDGLKGDELDGPVALWTYSEEASYFSNMKIENAQPAPLHNSGEIAGTRDTAFLIDAAASAAL